VRRRSARGEGAALRQEIIAAAERLLLSHGSDEAVSIRAVADLVGVTPPSIYRHFTDKRELILAVCEHQFARFNDAMSDAVKPARGPLGELRAMGKAYIEFGLNHPEAYTVMFMRPPPSLDGYNGNEQDRPAAFVALVEAVQRAVDAGELETPTAAHAAQVIWSVVHGLTSLLIAHPHFQWSDKSDLVDDALRACVAPFLPDIRR